jgi:hypothetical protein
VAVVAAALLAAAGIATGYSTPELIYGRETPALVAASIAS